MAFMMHIKPTTSDRAGQRRHQKIIQFGVSLRIWRPSHAVGMHVNRQAYGNWQGTFTAMTVLRVLC